MKIMKCAKLVRAGQEGSIAALTTAQIIKSTAFTGKLFHGLTTRCAKNTY